MQKCHSVAEQMIHLCNGRRYCRENKCASAIPLAQRTHTHNMGQKGFHKNTV